MNSFIATRRCAKPDIQFTHRQATDTTCLIYTEETGTLWLWAWPELLGHSEPITWLFSPVTGKKDWPGDLWGIDEQGTLIFVETKRAKNGRSPHDPFADFISDDGPTRVPDVARILKHWEPLWRAEQFFLKQCGDNLEQGTRETAPMKWSGVVPYSLQRVIVWRWRELYRKEIMPKLTEGDEQKVRRLLDVRQQSKNDQAHYFGLFTVVTSGKPALSPIGKAHWEKLKGAVGKTRVHLRAVQLVQIPPDQVEISSYEPEFAENRNSVSITA
jgi:hypothetical protein